MSSSANVSSGSTVDDSEAAKFALSISEWWDTNGPQQALHDMNMLRVPFIVEALTGPGTDYNKPHPMDGYSLLEVGCGGGILSEVCLWRKYVLENLEGIAVLIAIKCKCTSLRERESNYIKYILLAFSPPWCQGNSHRSNRGGNTSGSGAPQT